MVLRRSPSLVNTSATKRADIIGRQTVPAFRKATVKRRISSSITSTLISLGLLCRKKKGKSAINSKNAVDIIEQSNYQFRQWNEASKNVADYNNPDAVKAAIPDGQLCSAGNVGAEWDERSKVWNDKSGLDAVTAGAPPISKTSEGKIDIVYDATATHDPSFFEVYISRPDYNAATAPLKWSDWCCWRKSRMSNRKTSNTNSP